MQIRIAPGGKWHRREAGGGNRTACAQDFGAFLSRDDRLDDEICEICFTPHERDTGRMRKIELELTRDADPDMYFDPDEEPTDPNGEG